MREELFDQHEAIKGNGYRWFSSVQSVKLENEEEPEGFHAVNLATV